MTDDGTDDSNDIQLLRGTEYYERQTEAPTFIVEPLLARGSVMMFYGESGRGKTTACYQLAHAIASEKGSWFGFDVHQTGPVLFLELDMMDDEMHFFLNRVNDRGLLHNDIWFPDLQYDVDASVRWEDFDILDDGWQSTLEDVVAGLDPTLVVVDTVEDAYEAAEISQRRVKQILERLRLAVRPAALLFTRHTRKVTKAWGEKQGDIDSIARGGFSGFGQWEQAPTATSMQIAQTEDDETDELKHVIKLHKVRLGDPGFRVLEVERDEHGFYEADIGHQQLLKFWPDYRDDPDDAIRRVSSVQDVCRQIAKDARANPETVRTAFYRAKDRGTVYEWEDEIRD